MNVSKHNMHRAGKKRKLDLREQKVRGDNDLLGSYEPPSAAIQTYEALWKAEIPEWDTRPVKQLNFWVYIQRSELLLNGVIMKIKSGPKPEFVWRFFAKLNFFRSLHDSLLKTLCENYNAFRKPENRGNMIYSSKAQVISMILAKAGYISDLLEALVEVLRLKGATRKGRKLILFEAPFLKVDEILADGFQPQNGEVKVPARYCQNSKSLCQYLYDENRLLYPHTPVGSYTQGQLISQLLTLAEAWDKIDLLQPGIYELVVALHIRFKELQSLAFPEECLELDQTASDVRPEPNRGLHPEAPSVQKQLQFGKRGLEIEDNSISKEIIALKKQQDLCSSLSSEYQIRVLGILVPFFVDLNFAREILAPRLQHAEPRALLAPFVAASFVRVIGAVSLLFPEEEQPEPVEPGTNRPRRLKSKREMTVPMVYGTGVGNMLGFPDSSLADYRAFYDAMRLLLLHTQKMPLDETTKGRLCTEMRLMQVTYGAAETNCIQNKLRWSAERRDLEDSCIPRITQTYQMVHWETRPVGFFLRTSWPITMRLVMARYMIDAITSSQAVQKRICSRDAIVISHTLECGALMEICNARVLPFILQFGNKLFFHIDERFFPCGDIVEALMIWFAAVYSQTGGIFRERSLQEVKLGYVEMTILKILQRVPEEILGRYRRLVNFLAAQKEALPPAEDDEQMVTGSDEPEELTEIAGEDESIYDLIAAFIE